jgi:succinate dehydrogenase hydrophobic anchor subunit
MSRSAPMWMQRLTALLFAAMCLVVGVVLIISPWQDHWKSNWFGNLSPEWGMLWMEPWVRGAISGLGLLNTIIAASEAMRLSRFHAAEEDDDESE